jgi:hypothetical protein
MDDKTKIKIPKEMESKFNDIISIIDNYCKECLNDEYQALSEKALAMLCRKRPSPIINGATNIWAAGIVYAIGQVNFLFDKSNKPYTTASELTAWFNISKSTVTSKAKFVRDTLKISTFGHKWLLQSFIDDSSMVWMIMFNGYIVDIRTLPLQVQIEAHTRGIIPYVPALKGHMKK